MGTTKTLLFAMLGMFALALSVAPASAQATRTWVSGLGDDANPCSRTAPCKTFAGAISKTAVGGEIDCLDPGGFGALAITKAITIDCSGTQGSVLVSGTNGIVVAAGGSDKVILRGINFNGANITGLDGIKLLSAGQLTVERCFIFGFSGAGIEVALTAPADVFINNTYITRATNGILANASGGISIVVVSNTIIDNVVSSGLEARSGIVATITNSNIAGSNNGVLVSNGSQVNVDGSTLVNNNIALHASVAGATIRASNNSIYNNGTNFSIAGGATIASNGLNRITSGGGAPNSTVTQQ